MSGPPANAPVAARNVTRASVVAERVETAASLWGKFMGLMGRRNLPHGSGLWLPASNGIHMFFMQISIDAIFLGRAGADGSRRVLSVHRGLRPWTGIVPLIRGADGCLELPTGTIDESGTTVGDWIRIGA
ncbi:MAG: hypothetical protein HW391_1888 [Chloroflexi bacterium]|nr:hypothetical protein [Chloroflexota bacterium]